MSLQSDREEFIRKCARAGLPADFARRIMRYTTTATRLAVAACNGDYPADCGDSGKRWRECPKCQGTWARASFRRNLCPDCRNDDLIRRACEAVGVPVKVSGDPRGHIVKVALPGPAVDSWTRPDYIGVPCPEV